MTRAGLLALAALVAGAGAAAAAGPSFDCARASEAHERLVCSDPALAKADADLEGVYRAALDRLGRDGRAQLVASQRGWLAFVSAVCPIPYPREHPGVSSGAADCLLGAYRERTDALGGAVRRVGPFTAVRLTAYAIRPLGPDDPGGHYLGGLAAGEVGADWIEPGGFLAGGDAEASRLDAALMPPGLRAGVPRFTVEPPPVLDTDSSDTSLDVRIEAVTPLIVTTRTVDWSYGHGTPHGWGYKRYGAVWRVDGRALKAGELFRAGTPWASLVEARINAETQPYRPIRWSDDGRDLADVELRPDAFAVNAGYVDGYAGGEKIVAVPWADLRPFLSERGRAVVDSFGR